MILRLLDSYENELNDDLKEKKKSLEDVEVKISETEKMIQLISEENQGFFTDFTPRPVAEKNADKLEELNQTLDSLTEEKKSIDDEITFMEKRIREVRESRYELTSSPSSSQKSSPEDSQNVSRETSCSVMLDKDKLHLVLSYLPQDPMRAKIELENLMK